MIGTKGRGRTNPERGRREPYPALVQTSMRGAGSWTRHWAGVNCVIFHMARRQMPWHCRAFTAQFQPFMGRL